jgi:hypothetical protein
MGDARQAIINGTFPVFVTEFMKTAHADQEMPVWVVESLASVGIDIQK